MITNYLAQANCTVNGQPASCGQAGGILAAIGVFIFIFWIIGIANFVFWLISLIHIIKHEDIPNRTMWIVLILLVPFADLVYFFGPRRKYNKGGGMPSMPPQGPPAGNMNPTAPIVPTAPISPAMPPTPSVMPPSAPTVAPQPPVSPQPPVPPQEQGPTNTNTL